MPVVYSRVKNYLDRNGLISKHTRKILIVNFIFQRVLRINSECPWSVHYTSKVVSPEKITIHESSLKSLAFSPHCYLQAINGIIIGKNTIWGPGVGMISSNHNFKDFNLPLESPPIQIGDNCWLGMNVLILPGVCLGNNVIVGAGSIVTNSFPSKKVIAGNPAQIIKDNL